MLNKDFQIGIVGLGLIGGSIARSLSQQGYEIFADDPDDQALEIAFKDKVINGRLEDIDLEKEIILIFTLPVLSFSKELEKNKEIISRASLVSDCLSVKKDLNETISSKGVDTSNFVLSHPVAGSEKSGFNNSASNLFVNKISVLTKLPETSSKAYEICSEMWEAMGASTIELSLEDHDDFFASTSHLPHLISFCLISAVSKMKSGKANLLSGGGLKDFTRIASSDPKMWEDIFISNKENILDSLNSFKTEIKDLENLIENSDAKKINDYIKKAKIFRDSLI